MASRSIFRESALEAHRRRASRDVLPRLTSWPLVTFEWVMLGGLLAAAALSWSLRVPAYVAVSGIVLDAAHRPAAASDGAAAVFVPLQQSSQVRFGQVVQARIGASAVRGVVVSVQPEVIGPSAARERFGLPADSAAVDGPATAAIVQLVPAPPATYGGTRVTGRIEVGSYRLLSSVPVIGSVLAGEP